MQIVRSGLDQPVEIGKTAQMRYAGDARIDGGQPVAERSAHRDPERPDAERVDVGPRGKPAERRREFAKHLARQRAAAPQPGLGQRALARARPSSEARQVYGEGHEAGTGQNGTERALQCWPAVEQFAGADVVAVAVGMNVQDRRKRTIRFRPSEDAPDRFSRLRLECEPFTDMVAAVVDLLRCRSQRVPIDFEQRSEDGDYCQRIEHSFARTANARKTTTEDRPQLKGITAVIANATTRMKTPSDRSRDVQILLSAMLGGQSWSFAAVDISDPLTRPLPL